MGKRNADQSPDHLLHESPLKRAKYEAASVFESPICNQEFELTREMVDGTILTDLTQTKWRVGKPIGKFPARLMRNQESKLRNILALIV